MTVAVTQVQSKFFPAMSQLLPQWVFNATTDFIAPQAEPATVEGRAAPGSQVTVSVNNVNQGGGSVVADQGGNWSVAVNLGQGLNTIVAQYES
jgi:hypothetical protein